MKPKATPQSEALPPPLPVFIAAKLTSEIEGGAFAPGERLSEEAIAARFGVSRAPVREALRILQREELVRIEPRRGASVISFSPEEVNEMFELRAALYGLAVELFTARVTSEAMTGLLRVFEQVHRAAATPGMTPEKFARATQKSSLFMVSRCGNSRVRALMGQMTRQAFRHFAALAHQRPVRRRETSALGKRMVQAIRLGHVTRAGMLARKIVKANHKEVMRQLARTTALRRPQRPAWPD